jgi:NAD(P)-dependent dehydrogenase (short-subunit alcohol dehydrogenase family)
VREFKDRVAVVTGAASGLGQAMAERFAAEGMKVVLADVEEQALARAAAAIEDKGGTVLPVLTDVSSYEAVEALANKAFATFGNVHVLCNNAGVSSQEGRIWEAGIKDWQWIVGVNLFGVAYGIHAFVPRMLAAGEEGHVVNTASTAGLTSEPGGPGINIYGTTKHAVIRMSEGLHYDLRAVDSRIHVSVLCPHIVATRILEAERNRPSHLANDLDPAVASQQAAARAEMLQRFQQIGMPASQVADMVFEAIQNERFYILTHPKIKANVRKRMEDILEERVPEPMALSV